MTTPRKPMGFLVRLIPPPGTHPSDLREYVEDAVATWKGSYRPEDPIFGLDGDTVRVSVRSLSVRRLDRVEDMQAQIERLAGQLLDQGREINRLTVERDQLMRRLLDCMHKEGEGVSPATPKIESRRRANAS
jgi:hypothetical protein